MFTYTTRGETFTVVSTGPDASQLDGLLALALFTGDITIDVESENRPTDGTERARRGRMRTPRFDHDRGWTNSVTGTEQQGRVEVPDMGSPDIGSVPGSLGRLGGTQ
jgi:hypothetical protein